MKSFVSSVILFLCAFNAFSSSLKDAEMRIGAIEEFKSYIDCSKSEGDFYTDDEYDTLSQMYSILENDEYVVSSFYDDFVFDVDDYDVEKLVWNTRSLGSFFEDKFFFDYSVSLPYSAVLEKKFLLDRDMTEHQRRDYEFYVNEYECRFQNDEKVLFAELSFHIKHWEKANVYRLVPVSFRIYKVAKYNRLIYSVENPVPEVFMEYGSDRDFRSPKQMEREKSDIEKNVNAELKNEKKDENLADKILVGQKGRRSFCFSFNSENFDMDVSRLNYETFKFTSVEGMLTWGIGRIFFGGVGIGIDLETAGDDRNSAVYLFDCELGAGYLFFRHFRPFVQGKLEARTDDVIVYSLGTGMDLVLGYFMLSGGLSYNIPYEISSDYRKTLRSKNGDENLEKFPSYFFGIGLTW